MDGPPIIPAWWLIYVVEQPQDRVDGNQRQGYNVEMASDDSGDETVSIERSEEDEEMEDDSDDFVNDRFFSGEHNEK